MTMQEIIDQLKTWEDDIKSDIIGSWATDREKSLFALQRSDLIKAIALLENIGENYNISL